jgi:DNA-binding transcriptional ArsR family regulator
MIQLDLNLELDPSDEVSAMCRNSDQDTSLEAALGIRPNIGRSRRIALQALLEAEDGLTDFELADKTGYQQTSIGKRRTELRNMGLVADSGRRRKTPSGASAIVWRAQ